jgi:hypothetical protein
MIRWIETRDVVPPKHMQVLFYVRDEIEGYTEDTMRQGCVINIENEGTINEKVLYSLDLDKNKTISHWTLLPPSPTPWRL